MTVWVGIGLTGGNFEGAVKVGTIEFVEGQLLYIFSNLSLKGSSVQLQGGSHALSVAEVEVYQDLGKFACFFNFTQ